MWKDVICSTIPRTSILIFFVITFLFVQTVQAQQTVHVCALDGRNNTSLSGATIRLVTDQTAFESQTGPDGCVHFFGQIPVGIDASAHRRIGLEGGKPYPNPTSGQVSIPFEAPSGTAVQWEVFDVQGRRLGAPIARISSGTKQIQELQVGTLADGVYFYRASSDAGVATGKIVKNSLAAGIPGIRSIMASGSTQRDVSFSGALVDSVQIEVVYQGFLDRVDRRIVKNGQVIKLPLFRRTNELLPLIDMKGYMYLGTYPGGLYPDQQNEMPASHYEAGLEMANSIEPLNTQGQPDPNGKIIFTSIGMSTTSSVFCGVADPNESCKVGSLMSQVVNDDLINDRLVFIDGADPGKTADEWEDPTLRAFRRVEEEELTPFGHSELQVQVAWVKLASSQPAVSLPNANSDALMLKRQIGNAMRALRSRYPNLKMVFFSSRVYGGYATSTINPEPYAYESGFATKWVIDAQIRQMHEEGAPIDPVAGNLDYTSKAPWIAWGAYYWADGQRPRSDGMVWVPDDLKGDGTHLAKQGIEKITAILLDFFKTSPHTRCWFLKNGTCE